MFRSTVRIACAAAALVLAAVPLAAADSPQMREGKWKITMTMEMPDMPVKMPPIVQEQCFTKEEVADPKKSLPSSGNAGSDCEMTDHKVDGKKVTWKMKCPSSGVTGTGEVEYGKDVYSGIMAMSMKQDGKTMDMTTKFDAKRIGDCKK